MRKRIAGFITGGGALVLSTFVAAAPASASDAGTTAEPAEGRYCVSLLGRAAAGQESPELYRYCSATPFDTRAHLDGLAAQPSQVGTGAAAVKARLLRSGASVRLLIVRAYADAGLSGNYWDYYADDADGRCDASGYMWRPDDYWSTHVSSLEKAPGTYCNTVMLYTRDKASSGKFELPVFNLTATFNDNVGRMQIFDGNGRA